MKQKLLFCHIFKHDDELKYLFQNHKNFYLVTSARHGSGQVRCHIQTQIQKNANTNTNTTDIAIHGSGKTRNLLEIKTESGQLEVDASELGDRPPITGASGISHNNTL